MRTLPDVHQLRRVPVSSSFPPLAAAARTQDGGPLPPRRPWARPGLSAGSTPRARDGAPPVRAGVRRTERASSDADPRRSGSERDEEAASVTRPTELLCRRLGAAPGREPNPQPRGMVPAPFGADGAPVLPRGCAPTTRMPEEGKAISTGPARIGDVRGRHADRPSPRDVPIQLVPTGSTAGMGYEGPPALRPPRGRDRVEERRTTDAALDA
jgi:hypothetical protein